MNLAKISANGQITLPADIRKILGVSSGDKVLFVPQSNGEVLISNASSAFQPLTKKQFLEELEISRDQAANGRVSDAKKAAKAIRSKHGL